MAYPEIYDVDYSYTGFQQAQGDDSFPGTQLDNDLAGLQNSVSEVALFMRGVLRSDGQLNNGVVTYDSLAPALQTGGIAPATAWLTATYYAVDATVVSESKLYRALIEHTSGVFATDLAAGKWVFIADLISSALLSGTITPKDVGCVCDGTTDDTVKFAEFIAAVAASGKMGVIAANDRLALTAQTINVTGDVKIQHHGAIINLAGASQSAVLLKIAGDGTNTLNWTGTGMLDGNGGGFTLLNVDSFEQADVEIGVACDMLCTASSPGTVSAIYVSNTPNNTVKIHLAFDLEDGASIQGSIPRAVSVASLAESNSNIFIGDMRNVHDVVVIGSMGGGVVNIFGRGFIQDTVDNIIYNVGDASKITVSDLIFDTVDEAIVNTGSGVVYADRLFGTNILNALGVGSVTGQQCGGLHVSNSRLYFANGAAAFRTRTNADGVKTLGVYDSHISLKPTGRALQLDGNGTIEEFIDLGNTWVVEYNSAISASQTLFVMTPGSRCRVQSDSLWMLTLASGSAAPAGLTFFLNMPTVTEQSFWHGRRLNLTGENTSNFRLSNARQQLFTFSNSFSVTNIQSEREINQGALATAAPRQNIYSSGPPTSGYWPAGQVILAIAPSASNAIAWLCTAAGSPGTWIALGALTYGSSLLTSALPIVLPSDPTTAMQAATKQYVDNTANGLDIKHSCRAATTGNITLSAPQTIDGVSIIAGDRVLVKDQTAPAENGIYACAAGAWTRVPDMNAWSEFPGASVWIEEGSTNADKAYVCTVNAGGTIDTTAVTWTQFGGTGAFQAADATLTALAALDGTAGQLTQTGADTFAKRTLTGTANEIAVANGDGALGDPTLSLPSTVDLSGKTLPGVWRLLDSSAVSISRNSVNAAGDATETAIKTVTVPGNALGPNGMWRAEATWEYTNSANAKTLRTRWGGLAGGRVREDTVSTTASLRTDAEVQNVNSASSQKARNAFNAARSGMDASTGALPTNTLDTTASQDIAFTAAWAGAVSGETITLAKYAVWVCYRP